MLDLTPFCCKPHECRRNIETPWNADGFTFATNGRLIVRVAQQEVPEILDVTRPDWQKTFNGEHDRALDWVKIDTSEYAPKQEQCEICKGTGKGPFVCDECKGEGEIECYSCRHTNTCDDCDGKGKWGDADTQCEECGGKGEFEKRTPMPSPCGPVDARFVALLNTLPGCEFGVLDESFQTPIPVRFHDGIGLLMSMHYTPNEPLWKESKRLRGSALGVA